VRKYGKVGKVDGQYLWRKLITLGRERGRESRLTSESVQDRYFTALDQAVLVKPNSGRI